MKPNSIDSPLVYIGDDEPRGSYVLRIRVREHLTMRFGRFKGGKLIHVQLGEYVFIGSAMAARGATCLANRLLRHATRCEDKEPHAIRAAMLREFPRVGLANTDLRAPSQKTLRWNVDHLLDTSSAELVSAYVIRSPLELESDVGDMLENDNATSVFEKGLGANDRPGHTHLLRVSADDTWWNALPARLNSLWGHPAHYVT